MVSIYNYQFEHDGKQIVVHFVDKCYNIDKTEALSQIDHASRRRWAIESIQLMNRAGELYWTKFPIQHDMECLFGKRLIEENWENSTAFLRLSGTKISFYINRLFYFNLFNTCTSNML